MGAKLEIRPQAGPQEAFAACSADIGIYGGSAGSGKTFGMVIEPLRHVMTNREFAAVFFRRETPQITNPGGLWDEASKLYPLLGAKPRQKPYEWTFPYGGKVVMSHLEQESTVYNWQGSAIPLLMFDELTHFTRSQFFYMITRNRSMCGVKPYVRASCNPDADSWVAEFIAWWIDQDTGYPIPERSGALRWFIVLSDIVHWADSKDELYEKFGRKDLPIDHEDQIRPKSCTFISAKLTDNKIFMKADPDYLGNLKMQSNVQQERLIHGNWKIKPAAGLYFKRHEVTMLEGVPNDVVTWVRKWDLAASAPTPDNPNPDRTAGVLMGRRKNGRYVVADCISEQLKSAGVRELVQRVAKLDSRKVIVGITQDPAQAGKEQAEGYVKLLAGYRVKVWRETGDKIMRADPFAAQWQQGNVDVVRGPWNEHYFGIMEGFPGKGKKDEVDASSGAFSMLAKPHSIFESV